jgi:hypothetical protein
MNKYQEALDALECSAYYGGEKGENVEQLQELVDRATPKKPYLNKRNTIQCGNCGSDIYIRKGYFYCGGCGHKIDWSEDN